MRSWLIYAGAVVVSVVVLWLLATGFPAASYWIFLIGTPIIVVGAALGAKLVQLRNRAARADDS